MKVYQAVFHYGAGADDAYYYGGSYGKLYSSKDKCIEAAEKELHPTLETYTDTYYDDDGNPYEVEQVYELDWMNTPTSYTILEHTIID